MCAQSTAVGSGQTCTPMAEMTGMATVSEQRPKPDRSLIAATRFGTVISDSTFPKFYNA